MLTTIVNRIQSKGWEIYQRPYMMNVVGVRSEHTRAGYFDDTLHVFYRDKKEKWNHHQWRATLDPGLPYLHLPLNAAGTAIIAEGQYTDAYSLGFHRDDSTRPALVQNLQPVWVIRDNNRDNFLDLDASEPVSGMFGLNVHRTSYQNPLSGRKEIRRDSAGCTVLEDPDEYDDEFLPLMRLHRDLHGNVFTYTVLDLRDLRRFRLGRWALRFGAALALGLAGLFLYPQSDPESHEE